jgi:hypothetical protein
MIFLYQSIKPFTKNLVTTRMEVGVQTPEETLSRVDLAEILHGY